MFSIVLYIHVTLYQNFFANLILSTHCCTDFYFTGFSEEGDFKQTVSLNIRKWFQCPLRKQQIYILFGCQKALNADANYCAIPIVATRMTSTLYKNAVTCVKRNPTVLANHAQRHTQHVWKDRYIILYIIERIVSDSERVLLRDNLMALKFSISILNTFLLSELMNDLQLLWLKIPVLWQNQTTAFLHMTFWLQCLFGYINFQKQNALFWMFVDIEMFDFHESN